MLVDPLRNADVTHHSIFTFILALGTALLTVSALRWKTLTRTTTGRHHTIDGLRGYLAFAVFLYHSEIWFRYIPTGEWKRPDSLTISFLGSASVACFFIITSFLFTSKLLEARKSGLDWIQLCVGRVLRIGPLYLFSLAILYLLVLHESGYVIREEVSTLAGSVIKSLALGALGLPPLNGVPNPSVMVAGVYWTLAYEWFFYGTLPLLGLCFGHRPPIIFLGLTLLSGGWLLLFKPPADSLLPFLSGIFAAFAVRAPKLRKLALLPAAPVLLLVGLIIGANGNPSPFAPPNLILLTLFFICIAAGNSLFGLLSAKSSIALGELSYGIYLLHGLILYVTLASTPLGHVLVQTHPDLYPVAVAGLTPPLILLSYAAYHWIERPGIQAGRTLAQATTNFLNSKVGPSENPS
jgi:peptidoglycan/LPS O-acetylase OafA/YrhL